MRLKKACIYACIIGGCATGQKAQSGPGTFAVSLVTVAVITSTSISHVAEGLQTKGIVHIDRPA
jgi:hypothetical protein